MYLRSVPCWLGMVSIGSGTSTSTLGMMSGMTPKKAYLASNIATRASRGQAGNGKPLGSDWSISAVRSRPVIVSVEFEPLSPGEIWLFVMTPSISTLATPLTVATMTQRMKRSGIPPVSKNRICNGDCLSMLNTSWKPLSPTSSIFPSTDASASMTARGGVIGTIGPIISESWTFLSTRRSRHAKRRSDREDGARRRGEIVGPDRAVGVADQPGHQRIAQIFRGDEIEPVALPHDMARDRRVVGRPRLRHDAPREIGDRLSVRRG